MIMIMIMVKSMNIFVSILTNTASCDTYIAGSKRRGVDCGKGRRNVYNKKLNVTPKTTELRI